MAAGRVEAAGLRRAGLALLILLSVVIGHASPAGAERALLWTRLSGAAAVPPGDPDGFGQAAFIVTPELNRVCAVIVVRNIAPATAAHVHFGAAGQTGGHAVDLDPPIAAGWSYSCGIASNAAIDLMFQHPEALYLNVHNEEYPDGALRGQLALV